VYDGPAPSISPFLPESAAHAWGLSLKGIGSLTWFWYVNRSVGVETMSNVTGDLKAMHQGVRR
jgi:hypothetical protein